MVWGWPPGIHQGPVYYEILLAGGRRVRMVLSPQRDGTIDQTPCYVQQFEAMGSHYCGHFQLLIYVGCWIGWGFVSAS